MRDLTEVLQQILDLDPPCKEQLNSVRQSALYASPESIGIWWIEAANILQEHFGDDPSKWSEKDRKIIGIWSNDKTLME